MEKSKTPSPPTDLDLQLFLAKQLPEEIQVWDFNAQSACENIPKAIPLISFKWKKPNTLSILCWIKETEWDYIVRRVEEKLTDADHAIFRNFLNRNYDYQTSGRAYSAPWQTRAAALKKVKGETP